MFLFNFDSISCLNATRGCFCSCFLILTVYGKFVLFDCVTVATCRTEYYWLSRVFQFFSFFFGVGRTSTGLSKLHAIIGGREPEPG